MPWSIDAATIYQSNANDLTCSGSPEVASIGTCYNTSWIYYSIDECSSVTTAAAAATLSPASNSSSSGGVSTGVIAGAVVACVLGLGIIAALCTYFFWFRPEQQAKKNQIPEQVEAAAVETQTSEEAQEAADAALKDDHSEPVEMHQLPSELHSPMETMELASATLSEAPGDGGGYELSPETPPVELPGGYEYRGTSDETRNRYGGKRD